MASKAATYVLRWNAPAVEAGDVSHRWVLTGMEQHGQALLRVLWRILGNEQDVCDAYQDTFLQLAHCLGGEEPKHVKAYLLRTGSNIALSVLRRRRLHQRICRDYAHNAQDIQQPDAARELDFEELREAMRTAIARLPEGLREVIVLHDLAELPYTQVARIMGITVPSARVYHCRAIQLLAKLMTRAQTLD